MKTIKCQCGQDIIFDDHRFSEFEQLSFRCRNRSLTCWVIGKGEFNVGRLIVSIPVGFIPDHVNGNNHDNRECNIRAANHQQNSTNRKVRSDNLSGLKGVGRIRGKWRAIIVNNGKHIHLGYFEHAFDAAKAYDEAAIKYFGEFARLNNVVQEVSK